MSSSDKLRQNINQHSVKNTESKLMDSDIGEAVISLMDSLRAEYPALNFEHEKNLYLTSISEAIATRFPHYKEVLAKVLDTSYIKPDGGFLYATDEEGNRRLVLVAEVKRQGTNDKRASEGLPKQAQGNAIERLGKNLAGIRVVFKHETIIPFICFGSGYDFKEGSSILDRVVTMNEGFALMRIFVEKKYPPHEPVSMMFRESKWSTQEMIDLMKEVAVQSIEHYFGPMLSSKSTEARVR